MLRPPTGKHKMDQLKYYYKNATSDSIDAKHSVSLAELKKIAPQIRQITSNMAQERRAGKLPYRDLPYQSEMVDAINKAVEHFRTRCEILIVLGIGGSALGNIALQNALNPYTYNLQSDRSRAGPQLFILDNVDPDQIRSIVELITPKIKKTVLNVISKSGETAETAAQFILFRDLLKKHLGTAHKDNILATTDPKGGTLRQIATDEGYKTLEVPDGVGGRFSVLSAVGLFSAAMCGIDIEELLEGAADMDKRAKKPDLFENPSAMIGALHYLLDRKGKKIAVMMPYSTALYSCADWFRQLWAESLGKKDGLHKKNVFAGQTPIKALGTTDQHSQVQLYREGPNDKIITFLEIEKFQRPLSIPDTMKHVETLKYLANSSFQTLINNEKIATEYALMESDRPTATVIFPRISPHTVGQFLYMYEVAVSYMGSLLEINTYDQPGVELGKKATFALMGRPGYEAMKKEIAP